MYRVDEMFCEMTELGHVTGWRPIAYFESKELAHEFANSVYDDEHIVDVFEDSVGVAEVTDVRPSVVQER